MDVIAIIAAIIATIAGALLLRRPARASEAIGAAQARVDAADRAAIEARAVAAEADAVVDAARAIEEQVVAVDATDAQAVADAIADELARVRR